MKVLQLGAGGFIGSVVARALLADGHSVRAAGRDLRHGRRARMRNLARHAALADAPLPPAYHRLYGSWFAFGFPAFAAVLAIVWLMLARPALRQT